MEGWVLVHSFNDVFTAEIARQVLLTSNIEAVVVNKRDSSYVTLGNVELYVEPANVAIANELLKEF
ncbi:MAG TPA: DUF2007 domain-containing protein [Williamwhitmania sp.]|jgi:uncharacterized membrane protein YvbJ|nr:DUF2007 domain-containing protein [Williamwhitmania sp.]